MTRVLLLLGLVLALMDSRAGAEDFEAVSGRISPDYVRAKLPDGSFQQETYTFGKGGYWGSPLSDLTIEKMDFMEVAHTIAPTLADQRYVPSTDTSKLKLLIMVYWGTTRAPEHASESIAYSRASESQMHLATVNSEIKAGMLPPSAAEQMKAQAENELSTSIAAIQAENRMRDMQNRNNAMMLGYDSLWLATSDAPNGTPLELEKRDMLEELEHYRYFVVLMAYDFQLMLKEKKHKLLWETRFSIREQNHEFDKQLAAMALEASKYFGKDSGGLVHDTLPEAHVDIGTIKNLGTVTGK